MSNNNPPQGPQVDQNREDEDGQLARSVELKAKGHKAGNHCE